MTNHYRSLRRLPRRWVIRTALTGLLTTASWMSGLSFNTVLLNGWQPNAAYAQAVTTEEISSYAAAVWTMDASRIEAYNQISDILTSQGYDVTNYDLSCPNAQSLDDVPRQVRSRVRTVLIDYCNNARRIVEDSGLTVRRFNAITQAHREDEELAQQIQAAIATIQQ